METSLILKLDSPEIYAPCFSCLVIMFFYYHYGLSIFVKLCDKICLYFILNEAILKYCISLFFWIYALYPYLFNIFIIFAGISVRMPIYGSDVFPTICGTFSSSVPCIHRSDCVSLDPDTQWISFFWSIVETYNWEKIQLCH